MRSRISSTDGGISSKEMLVPATMRAAAMVFFWYGVLGELPLMF